MVRDIAVTEGNAAVTATFAVKLSAQSGQTVTVKYKTANGTATAPAAVPLPPAAWSGLIGMAIVGIGYAKRRFAM